MKKSTELTVFWECYSNDSIRANIKYLITSVAGRSDQLKQVVTAGLGLDCDVSGASGLHMPTTGTEESSVGRK